MVERRISKFLVEVKQFALSKELLAVENPTPYYVSQIADADPKKIEKFYGRINDLEATHRFGTDNSDEFSYWAWRSCGICGVQMILQTELGKDFKKTTMDLVKEGLDLKGYDIPSDIGWYHQALVELASKYGVKAQTHKFVPSIEIALEIQKQNYVLASIKSEHGGHLLLVYGYKLDDQGKLKGFFVHDSNNYQEPGENKFVTVKEYERVAKFQTITFERKNYDA